MAEGSLVLNINQLQTAFAGIQTLLGAAPEGDGTGTGLAGAAHIAVDSPGNQVLSFAASFTGQVEGLFDLETASSLSAIGNLFGDLAVQVEASPTAELATFVDQIGALDSAANADFLATLQHALDTINAIRDGVPPDHSAIVSALLDQILAVLGSLSGPEADAIQAWIQSLTGMQARLAPLIAAAQSAPNPETLAIEVVQHVVDNFLGRLGFDEIQRFVTFLDDFPGNALAPDLLTELSGSLDVVTGAYGDLQGVVDADWPQFRATAVAAIDTMHAMEDKLRAVLEIVERIAGAKIFQPHALEGYLREQFEQALAIPVQDVQQIDGPYNALLDRIDAAIEGIDLTFISDDISNFFTDTRTAIEQANIGGVGELLQSQLTVVSNAVDTLQQGVTDLLTRIQAFFDNLLAQARSLTESFGTFLPDGSFQYDFQDELSELFNRARLALAGDPANPGAASLTTSLDQFQSTIDQFLNQLSGLLPPVAAEIGAATTAAVNGINDFTAFVNGLDMPTLLEELRQKVEGILDALLPIDFAAITDPILQEIEENQTKLSEIDASSLNDLLREALAVALDVVISIDFTVEISNPLKEQFAQVKAVPQAALDQLQARYEAALGMLDALSPTQLLDALLSAFDIIEEAVSSIDVATLLQPLDKLHEQYLVQPLDQLQPSVLLAPLSDAFQEFLAIFDTLDSSTLLAPVVAQLDALKTTVAAIDITGWIDDLLAAVADVQAQIAAIRPSELFAPLLADFERLEGELDRFKPSVVFAPVADLATPLLDLLETIQQETIDALFAIFQAPLAVLDRLQPDALTSHIQSQIDAVLAALRTVNFPARYNQLKASYFDFNAAVNAGGVEAKVELAGYVDPDDLLGEVAATYNILIAALEGLKTNVAIPDLSDLYVQMRERLLSLLPPYAQQLLNPETFKRLLRLADPTRFLADLDARFEAIKAKLLPIRPEEITGELDATYETVLGLVDGLQLDESLNQVKSELTRVQGIVNTLRVDFLAADIQHAIDEMQAVLAALDPTLLFADLDSLHAELVQVVDGLKPSEVLAGLQTLLTQIQDLVNSVNPRTTLEPPLVAAWAAIEGILDEIDFTIVLSPLVDKLDEIEAEFEVSLGEVEDAFDDMLRAARGVLSAGGSASVGVGVSV